MMKFLRSQSQTVLVIVLGVIGLGFLFYGNAGNLLTSAGGHVSNDYGRIDGEDLTFAELTDAVRNTHYSLIMGGHAQQLTQVGARAQVAEEAWRQLLLLREADRLHIEVSDQELIDYIRNQSVFQKDGVYSPDAYRTWLGHVQGMLHIQPDTGTDPLASTEAAVEAVMRNTLRTDAVNKALFSTIRASAQDVAAQYGKLYGPSQISLVSFDPKSFEAAAQVTPEEIEAEYKAHPQNPAYRTKEKRKVDYVLFSLTADQAKLTGADKNAAMQALGEKALDFALAFQPDPSATPGVTPPPPDFMAEAKKRNFTPGTTDFFTVDTPPANLPPSPSFNNAAFALTKDDTISKVIELPNGVAILHLTEIQPSDLLPLDQVKADIGAQLRQVKGRQAEELTAANAATALKAAVAHGTDFKTAATGMNLKVETLPAFVPYAAATARQTDARFQTIAYSTTTLAPGQVSDPVPVQTDNSILVLHLDSRGAADPAGLAQFEARYRESADEQLRTLAYVDWATWKSKQPGTHKPPQLDAYGGVE